MEFNPVENPDTLRVILSFLPERTLLRIRGVNRLWRVLCIDLFWEAQCSKLGLARRVQETWGAAYDSFLTGTLYRLERLSMQSFEKSLDVLAMRQQGETITYRRRRSKSKEDVRILTPPEEEPRIVACLDETCCHVCLETLTCIPAAKFHNKSASQDWITVAKLCEDSLLFTGSWEGILQCWSYPDCDLLYSHAAHESSIVDLQVGGEGLVLSIGGSSIHVWSHLERRPRCELVADASDQVLAIAAGNGHFYAGYQMGSIRVWNNASVEETWSSEGIFAPVSVLNLHFHFLVSGYKTGDVLIWDSNTGDELRRLKPCTSLITGASLWGPYLVVSCQGKQNEEHGLYLMKFCPARRLS